MHVEMYKATDIDPSQLENACGAGYFITRFPRHFKVYTPFLNAAVEGTEFQVAVACDRTHLTVIEGKVAAESLLTKASRITLQAGQTTNAGTGEEPAPVRLLLNPVDTVQWTLHFPQLTEVPTQSEPGQCGTLSREDRTSCLAKSAEAYLRMGRFEKAEAEIADLLDIANQSPDATALYSVIALVKNEKIKALELASKAVELSSVSARAWIALSYAQQAHFNLEASLNSAKRAEALTPGGALALARVAELQLSLGQVRDARQSAEAAVRANPMQSHAHSTLGFVRLADLDVYAARDSFKTAIALSSIDPLPRLGLGLTEIRLGNLVLGREHMEIAVVLDPYNSLLRSQVGKAYFEERTRARDDLALNQLTFAEQLDRMDPTPHYYAAILLQSLNRPTDALKELTTSISKNDNRAVYRSRLLLDDDAAVRAAGLGRLYQGLGLVRRGIIEAFSALSSEPANHAAHRFLADVYATQPRHEIARVSESLQAQLRQPLSAPAVEPELADDRLGVAKEAVVRDFSRQGLYDWGRLFAGDGLQLQLQSSQGTHNTRADQQVASAKADKFAFGVGHFHYATDGFEDNSDSRREVFNAFVQADLNSRASVQAEARSADAARGITFFANDPTYSFPIRFNEHLSNYRVGARVELSIESELLASFSHMRKFATTPPVGFDPDTAFISKWDVSELQYVWDASVFNLISGGTRFLGKTRSTDGTVDQRLEHTLVYAYAQPQIPTANLALTLGVSHDTLKSGNLNLDQSNPKLGVIWKVTRQSMLRAARFRAQKRQLIANQTLEPTAVSGFNQFFDDLSGSDVWTNGLGFDQSFGSLGFLGAETLRRKLSVPALSETSFDLHLWEERTLRAYAYRVLPTTSALDRIGGWSIALSAEAQREQLDRAESLTGHEGIKNLTSRSVLLGLSAHHPSGVSLRIQATKARQDGVLLAFAGADAFPRHESFWIGDADLTYRIPGRRGFIAMGVRNLFDRSVRYLETDPVIRRYSPERFVFGRMELVF